MTGRDKLLPTRLRVRDVRINKILLDSFSVLFCSVMGGGEGPVEGEEEEGPVGEIWWRPFACVLLTTFWLATFT